VWGSVIFHIQNCWKAGWVEESEKTRKVPLSEGQPSFCLASILPGVLKKGLPYCVTKGKTAMVSSAVKQPVEKTLFIDESFLKEEFAKKPIEVAIYHTHNAETYIPLHGKSRDEGKNGGITVVGEEIVKTLAQHRVRAVQDLTIHDYPDHPTSYIKSKVTAKRLLEEYPDLKILIDLHRDAGIAEKQTVIIDGKQAAKLLFVMGNGQRIPNPHWRETMPWPDRLPTAWMKSTRVLSRLCA
jgi:stage II sporulation protein P